MKNKIYIKDWLKLKPYNNHSLTDNYYLTICNEVNDVIISNKGLIVLSQYLSNEEIKTLACFLTSYFEDLISETNIWNTFIKIHKRLYKKQLPFYVTYEYYENEINPQDIVFLIWYFMNSIQTEKFISPYNNFFLDLADEITAVFDKEWEYAPENAYLKLFYQIGENENDFYVARNLINTLLFKTYLFYPDSFMKLQEQEIDIIDKSINDDNLKMYLSENIDANTHKIHTRLLSLMGKEWVAEILGSNHALYKDFKDISIKIRGYFFYKGQDNNNIFIEHIASGKKFNLVKKSFDDSHSLNVTDTILFMGIVRWKNEWWFSGIFFEQSFNADLVMDEKKSLESRMQVDFLDHKKKEKNDILNMQFTAFKDFNRGNQIAFLPSESIEDFYNRFQQYFNNTLNLSKKDIKEAKQRMKDDGFLGTKSKQEDLTKVSETGLIFFNPNGGIEIGLGINSAFPLSNNPYFKETDSEDDIMFLFMNESFSTELAKYCIENCQYKLPFLQEGVGKKYLNDIDFLLRFWKKNNYHTIPSITMIGGNN